MTTARDDLTTPARRLPDLRLGPAAGGAPVGIRARGRRAPVLVLVHGGSCSDCLAYLRRIGGQLDRLREWDGQPAAVAPALLGGGPAGEASLPFPLLLDPEGRLAAALSVRVPAVVVADQWGEIHSAEEAGPEHRFPSPDELVDWARYLAVQCPECQGEAL